MPRTTIFLSKQVAVFAVVGLLWFGGGWAQGQFSGPAIKANPDQNVVPQATTDPSLLQPGQHDPVINAGDLVLVQIYNSPNYAPPLRVSVDGTLQLPLIGSVALAGLTINQAENLIARQLSDAGMYNNPQVTLQVTEAATQFATVTGEMHGIVPISGGRRLFDVLAAAGALPDTASHTITILRDGQPIIVDLGTDPAKSAQADITILPGDKIIVSKVGVVYILGAFKTQGAIPLRQNSPLTLIQATALSGGQGFEGKYKDLRIIRTVGLKRTMVQVDLKKVLNGKAPDPVLQADDIVFLPSDALRAAIKSGGINVVTNVISLLLVAGSNGGF